MRTTLIFTLIFTLLLSGITEAAQYQRPPATICRAGTVVTWSAAMGITTTQEEGRAEYANIIRNSNFCTNEMVTVSRVSLFQSKLKNEATCICRNAQELAKVGCGAGQTQPTITTIIDTQYTGCRTQRLVVSKCASDPDEAYAQACAGRNVSRIPPTSTTPAATLTLPTTPAASPLATPQPQPAPAPAAQNAGTEALAASLKLQGFGVDATTAAALARNNPSAAYDLIRAFEGGDTGAIQSAARAANITLNQQTVENVVNLTPEERADVVTNADAAAAQQAPAHNPDTFNRDANAPPLSYVTTGPNAGQVCFNDTRGCFSGTSFQNVNQCPSNPDCFNATAGVGSVFNDCTTASGVRFCSDPNRAYMASFPHLPLGTVAQVCNPDSGQCVYVAGVDYGPHPRLGNRIADLSREGAAAIGNSGLGNVVVTPVGFFAGDSRQGNAQFATAVARGMSQGLSLEEATTQAQASSGGSRTTTLASTPYAITGSVAVPAEITQQYNRPGGSGSPFANITGENGLARATPIGSPFAQVTPAPNNYFAQNPRAYAPSSPAYYPTSYPSAVAQPSSLPSQIFQPQPLPQPIPSSAARQLIQALQGVTLPAGVSGSAQAVAAIVVQPRALARGNPITVSWSSMGMKASAPCIVRTGTTVLAQKNEGSRIVPTGPATMRGIMEFTLLCTAENGQSIEQKATTTVN